MFGNSRFNLIISSIKSLLEIHSDFEVKSIKCKVNLVAHLLEKAVNSRSRQNSFHLIPPCIEHQLINEMV